MKSRVREWLLLGAAVLLALGLAYYFFVDQPIAQRTAQAASESSDLQVELMTVEHKLEQLQALEDEMQRISSDGSASFMPSYNSAKAEIQLLNDIMADAKEYTLGFSDVTLDGNQVRRVVTVTFTAPDYDTAVEMISKLSGSSYRCKLGNIQCSAAGEGADISDGEVQVALSATFYETMVGGTADAGLPEDAETEQ